jgi:alpha-ribazole phosphatase
MELILVRHPAVEVEPGICYGQSEIPLVEPAEAFVSSLVPRLSRLSAATPQRIDTSPLSRCASVATLLANLRGLPLHEDGDLMELDYGRWEMRHWDTVDRAELDAWAADLEHGRPHGGESAAMLAARANRWLERTVVDRALTDCALIDDAPAAAILAVTHAGVIRMLASRLTGESLAVSLRRPLAYGALCRFVGSSTPGARDISWRLADWNI